MNTHDDETSIKDEIDESLRGVNNSVRNVKFFPDHVKKIIHIDMDAFYASVEQRDLPSLKGKPVVVGGDPKSRGVVASASYEARKFGIKSAMPCSQAYRLCPEAVFVPPHFQKYSEASRKIRSIFESITPLVEPLSLDEAYLDVTSNSLNEPLAGKIAKHIKDRILKELQLTATAGVGPNKFVAKLASDRGKPNGLLIVPPEKALQFVEKLPVEQFWGVGPVTAKKLKTFGFKTAADIRNASLDDLERIVGSYAEFLYELSHGRDNRDVDPSYEPKSTGTETTFESDVMDLEILNKVIESQSKQVATDLEKIQRFAKTVTVKIKYYDFHLVTRSQTSPFPIQDANAIIDIARELLTKSECGTKPVRLIGVAVSNLFRPEEFVQLWFDFPK